MTDSLGPTAHRRRDVPLFDCDLVDETEAEILLRLLPIDERGRLDRARSIVVSIDAREIASCGTEPQRPVRFRWRPDRS